MISMTLKQRTEVFANVEKTVARKIFAPAFDAEKWKAVVDGNRQRILEADTVEAFEGEIQKLIAELKISHMVFFHHSLLKIPPNYAIGATFLPHGVDGSNYWMFQDVHEGGPADLSGMHAGDLLLEVEGRPVAPPEPPTFRMGGSCDVVIEKLGGERVSQPLGIPRPKSKWHPIIRPRLVSWLKPEPGIGLLKAAGFPGQVGIDVAREIDEAISNLRDCTRLIVDLRGNPGGGGGGLRLMSYLTPDKLPVGYSLTQQRAAKGFRREDLPRFGKIPSRKIALIPLLLRFALSDKSILMVTEGLGPQPFHGRIVLLVNQHTASASETITGFAKENRLATIVGTKTAGQVLGGTGFKVGHGFVLRLPVVGFRTWNGNTLEGKGVEPDQVTELSREALKEGRDNQLQEAIGVVKQL
ncbi:MAG: S41 family peptidase [Terriglobia bacterium]